MNKISILVKSFIDDIDYCKRLFKSFSKHNKDNLILYLVVPELDIEAFNNIIHDDNIEILSEDLFSKYLTIEDVNGIRPGYINQEIIKLAFHELGYCENYFLCDSDGYFIRDFFISDFLHKDGTPYSILVEDNELQVDPYYHNNHWIERMKSIEKIKEAINFDCQFILTSHGFSIFSAAVLRDLKKSYMDNQKLTYLDLMEVSPYEFSWYNLWLQKSKIIGIYSRGPLFKTFHYSGQHLEYIIRGVKEEDIARSYLGVVVNNNYSRDFGMINYESNLPKLLVNYISFKDLLYINIFKIKNILVRIVRKIKIIFLTTK